MNLTGDPIAAEQAYESVRPIGSCPTMSCSTRRLSWARKLSGQPPLAVQQIKSVSAAGDLDAGIESEKRGFATVFGSEDAREGISAFLQKRTARFQGK